MIPKIIHQIWFQGFANLPEKFLANVNSVKEKNPKWKYMEWDEISIVKLMCRIGQFEKYNSFNLLHQKIDFARYCILYSFGGVSVDTDCFALKGFNETPFIETSDFIVSDMNHTNKINNATILVSKENPILKEVIDNISVSCSGNNYKCIQKTTGPDNFNKLLSEHINNITILNHEYFEPCAGPNKYCEVKSNSILDHRHELSWITANNKKFIELYFTLKHYLVPVNKVKWQSVGKLEVGDIIETTSSIPFVKHYGIIVADNNVLHIYNHKAIIESQKKVFAEHDVKRVKRTFLTNEEIMQKLKECKDKKYNFIKFNCEDLVSDICSCSLGKDQRIVAGIIAGIIIVSIIGIIAYLTRKS